MKPLFTIHAGEYLVGSHIQTSPKLKALEPNVWIPAKDTGIDLLVTDKENLRAVSLQVKYSKDFLSDKRFLPKLTPDLRRSLRCFTWFTLNRANLIKSKAQFWVFVLSSFESNAKDFVVIPTEELRRRMKLFHRSPSGKFQSHFCSTTKDKKCWETRDLGPDGIMQIVKGTFKNPIRDFSKYLNEKGWAAVASKLKR